MLCFALLWAQPLIWDMLANSLVHPIIPLGYSVLAAVILDIITLVSCILSWFVANYGLGYVG